MSDETKNKGHDQTDTDPTASVSGDLGKLLEERERLEELLRNKYTKHITVMFTDMKGSTDLADSEGDLAARLLIKQHNDVIFPIIDKNNGHLVKTMGDGTLSYFNNAQDAVRCGVEIQKSVTEFNAARQLKIPIQVRIGIHTGQGLVEKKDIYGDVVNVASRIETQGNPGEVYLSEETYNAMGDKEEIYCSFQKITSLKGKKEPFKIYKAFWIASEIEADKLAPKTYTVEEKKKTASTSSILSQSQMIKYDKTSHQVAAEVVTSGPSVVIEQPGHGKRIVHLNQAETVIGRAPDADIILDETYVSRHHAKIELREGGYFIEDMGSRIGTTMNGEQIQRQELKFGDEISLGEIRITFVEPTAGPARKPSDPLAGAEPEATMVMGDLAKKLKLVVYTHEKEFKEFPVTGEEKVIGRHEEADIRLADNLVSRRHAKIWEENGQVYLEDMGSNNGTLVDGQIIPKTEPVLVHEKAVITICSFRMMLLNVLDKPDPSLFTSSAPGASLMNKVKSLWDKGTK